MIDVSVVVPCRDDDATLLACLEALSRQTLPRARFEVLLVDGGEDTLCGILGRRFGARVLLDEGRGPSAARNVGIRAARGSIVAFTDADCVPADDWLERLLEVLAEDARLAGVAGALRMPRRTLLGRLEDMEARAYYRGFITSNVAYRRAALVELGGFDDRLSCAEDYDLAWRLMDAGHLILHDPRPIVLHQPPEISGSLAGYLRKQVWYARHDVPTHALALARALRDPAPGSVGGAQELRRSFARAGLALAALSAPVLPRAGGLALCALLGQAAARVSRVARATGERVRLPEAAAMAGIVAARRAARAWGTALGAADLALRPTARAALFAPPSAGLPRPAAPPSAQAVAAAPSPRASAA